MGRSKHRVHSGFFQQQGPAAAGEARRAYEHQIASHGLKRDGKANGRIPSRALLTVHTVQATAPLPGADPPKFIPISLCFVPPSTQFRDMCLRCVARQLPGSTVSCGTICEPWLKEQGTVAVVNVDTVMNSSYQTFLFCLFRWLTYCI